LKSTYLAPGSERPERTLQSLPRIGGTSTPHEKIGMEISIVTGKLANYSSQQGEISGVEITT
jgi:hypothetical protein